MDTSLPRIVTFGEVMLRLAPPAFKRLQQCLPGQLNATFAGAEASVAASVAHLGGQATFVTAMPDNSVADACIAQLRSLGVETKHIVRAADSRFGVMYLETGTSHRATIVTYDRAHSAMATTPAAHYDWAQIFQGATWLLVSGITPAISRNGAEVMRVALREAARRGVSIALDVNYRSKLWRWDPSRNPRDLAAETLQSLLPEMDLFVGAPGDAALLGFGDADDSEADFARALAARYPRIRHVALTQRESLPHDHVGWGGMLFDVERNQIFSAPLRDGDYEPHVITTVVDRLGTGDAFTAGLLFALTDPELAAPNRAISFAVAAGCLAHAIDGDINLTSRAEIEALVRGDSAARVSR